MPTLDRFTVPTTGQFLDMARHHQGLENDHKLALLLKTSSSTICNWRAGRSHPDDDFAERIAVLANLDRGYVVSCFHANRSTPNASRYDLWRTVAARLRPSGTALAFCFAVALTALTFPGDASAVQTAAISIMLTLSRGVFLASRPAQNSPASAPPLVTF